jgi:hypothetical protein
LVPLVHPYTCELVSFSWVYTPSASSSSDPAMVLVINPMSSAVNDDGTGIAPPPEGSDRTNTVTLSTNLDPTSSRYQWDKVTVPQGGYYLSARLTGADAIYNTSSSFQVYQGPDISCLSAGGSSTGTPDTTTSIAINLLPELPQVHHPLLRPRNHHQRPGPLRQTSHPPTPHF